MNYYEVVDCVVGLATETDSDFEDILEALEGICWDEEGKGQVRAGIMS